MVAQHQATLAIQRLHGRSRRAVACLRVGGEGPFGEVGHAVVIRVGVTGEMSALLSALCTVGADRLIKLVTDRFFKEVESEVEEVAKRVRGKVREEVQAEKSGARIIEDTITGKAPPRYKALERRPPKPNGGDR